MDQSPDSRSWIEQDIDLREYIDVLVRRRSAIITCVVLAFVGAFLYSLSQTPVYSASATVQIEQERQSVLNFEDMWNSWASREAFYETQYRLLQSRTVAGRVAEKLGMIDPDRAAGADESPDIARAGPVSAAIQWLRTFPGEAQDWVRGFLGTAPAEADPEVLAAMETEDPAYRAAVNRILGGLSVSPVGNTMIVQVSWSSSDPVMAARVANAVVDEYIQHSLEAKYQASEQATSFLTEQIQILRDEIGAAERELQEYGSERDILSLDQSQDTVTQGLSSLNQEFLTAQSDRVQKQLAYEQLRASDPANVPEVYNNELIQSMKTDLSELQAERSELGRRFTSEHPQMQRLEAQISELQGRIDTEQQRIFDGLVANAEQLYNMAENREQRLSDMLQQQRNQTRAQNRDLIRYRQLQIEIDNKKELLDTLLQRLNEAGVSSRLQGSRTSALRKIDAASVPRSPSSPNTSRNLMYGLALGLLGGIGLSFFREHLDNTLRTPEEVEQRLGLPTLAWVPSLEQVSGRGRRFGYAYGDDGNGGYAEETAAGTTPELVTVEQPRSALAEAYRNLRTAILLSQADHPPQVVLTTSSVPGEGKTTTSINLAISLAQAGMKTLLLDADMRRPRVHRLLGLDEKRGLTGYLTGTCVLQQAMQPTDVKKLWAMPCGIRPPNPGELLVSPRLVELMDKIRESFDTIIIDTPPVMAVSDPLTLSRAADGVVLTIRGGTTPYPAVQNALKKIHEVRAKVLGVVINNVDVEHLPYHGYYRREYRYGPRRKDKDETSRPESTPAAAMEASDRKLESDAHVNP